MPVVHIIAKFLKDNYTGTQLFGAGIILGFIGLLMVVAGVFVKGDTKDTILGLIGGMLYWTGWVDFLFMYYTDRWGTKAEIDPVTGVVLSRPEYLMLSATFGLWGMVMVLYIFCSRNGCNLINWIQSRLFGNRKKIIAARPMTRHTSIVTFMEINMMLWSCYLLLMFCYDSHFIGRQNPITFAVAMGCLICSPYVFRKQLRLKAWGANIRMATATVIVFWIAVEAFNRTHIIADMLRSPEAYPWHWGVMALELIILLAYLFYEHKMKLAVNA